MRIGEVFMKIEVLADVDSVARKAAAIIAAEARSAVAARGRFLMAVSGGHTPWGNGREAAMVRRSSSSSCRERLYGPAQGLSDLTLVVPAISQKGQNRQF
jgi:hypothetical protein